MLFDPISFSIVPKSIFCPQFVPNYSAYNTYLSEEDNPKFIYVSKDLSS